MVIWNAKPYINFKSMIIFERLGGWGLANSLFQIATTVSIARLNNTSYAFPDNCSFRFSRHNPNNTAKRLFKHELPWVSFEDISKVGFERWGFGGVGFKQLPIINKLMVIDGFFQSEKYFKDYRGEIIELFKLKDEHIEYIDSKYKYLLNDNSCVIHMRRGDYATARELIILNIEYYKKAVELIGEDKQFIIFSDDISWCKNNFDFLDNKLFIEEQNDLLELHLMSLFSNHIIANSTFSWWGAWLANNSNVIMPDPKKQWFSEQYYSERQCDSNYDDLICTNWRCI
jgi:hypothetical protein